MRRRSALFRGIALLLSICIPAGSMAPLWAQSGAAAQAASGEAVAPVNVQGVGSVVDAVQPVPLDLGLGLQPGAVLPVSALKILATQALQPAASKKGLALPAASILKTAQQPSETGRAQETDAADAQPMDSPHRVKTGAGKSAAKKRNASHAATMPAGRDQQPAPAEAQPGHKPASGLELLTQAVNALAGAAKSPSSMAGKALLDETFAGERRQTAELDGIPGFIDGAQLKSLLLPSARVQDPETKAVLETLGLTRARFKQLARAQADFHQAMLKEEPSLQETGYSLRTQKRFSRAVLALARRLAQEGVGDPLGKALLLSCQSYYGDPVDSGVLLHKRERFLMLIKRHFGGFISAANIATVERFSRTMTAAQESVLGIPAASFSGSPVLMRAARALMTANPVLLKPASGSDAALMDALRSVSKSLGIELSTFWCHPLEEQQLVGYKVPRSDSEGWVFGQAELIRLIAKARREPGKRFAMLIKNVEAMDPGLRLSLQEALNMGELNDRELGVVEIPSNLQFIFTMNEGADLSDESFQDRVSVKSIQAGANAKLAVPVFQLPKGVTESNYLDHISIGQAAGAWPVLSLAGYDLLLAPEFSDQYLITRNSVQDRLFQKAGLVLDFETFRLLAAMAWARKKHLPILRIEGPTGSRKTFSAASLARLTGSRFFSNPVNVDTGLSDWIGRFKQDKSGRYRFHAETAFKERVESGGVVALSELNTLTDHNDKAGLAWWLTQIAETEPDADGYRTIRLTDIPAAEGEEVPVIRVHPQTLIVVDVNPEGEYSVRGAMPEVFKEHTPSLTVSPLVSGLDARREAEKTALNLHAEMNLKHGWTPRSGGEKIPGLKDAAQRKALAKRLVDVFYRVSVGQVRGEFGWGEHRVFSIREFKRMCQDVLSGLRQGRTEDQALAQAAYTHLASGWESPQDRGRVLELLESEFKLKAVQPDMVAAVQDQLMEKGRPLHLRVAPETDLRRELEALRAALPDTDISLVTFTDETDRFQLEGDLVPVGDGSRLDFGHGIFGRLIQKALGRPDRKVLYVFDDAHNLKPEEIVAADEFFQTGELQPASLGKTLRLPANANMLFISRTDSPLPWAAAERSRFVEMVLSRDEDWLVRTVRAAFEQASTHWPSALADLLSRWTLDLPEGWSEAKVFRWVQNTVQALGKSGRENLAEGIEDALRDNLLMAVPSSMRESMLWRCMTPIRRLLGTQDAKRSASPLRRLAGFQQESAAASDRMSQALSKLRRLLGAAAADPAGQETDEPALKPGDIVETYEDSGALPSGMHAKALARTPDGRHILLAEEDRIELLRKDETGAFRKVWSHEVENADLVALSDDAGMLVASGRFSGFKAFKLEGTDYRMISDMGHGKGPVTALALTPDGKTLAAGFFHKLIPYAWDGNGYKELLDSGLGSGVTSVGITADGGTIVASGKSHMLYAFRRKGGDFVHDWQDELSGERMSTAVSPDGKYILSGSGDGSARLMVQDESGRQAVWEEESESKIVHVSLTADAGHLLLVHLEPGGSRIRLLRFKGIEAGRRVYETIWEKRVSGSVRTASLAPDAGSILIDGEVRLFEPGHVFIKDEGSAVLLASDANIRRNELPVKGLRKRGFEARGKDLEAARQEYLSAWAEQRSALKEMGSVLERDAQEFLWERRKPGELKPLDVAKPIGPAVLVDVIELGLKPSQLRMSPDGLRILAAVEKTLYLFERARTGLPFKEMWRKDFPEEIGAIAMTSDGRTLLAGINPKKDAWSNKHSKAFAFLQSEGGYEQVWEKDLMSQSKALAATPDGSTIAVGDGYVLLYHREAGGRGYAQEHYATNLMHTVDSIALSDDGSAVAAIGTDYNFDGSTNKVVPSAQAFRLDTAEKRFKTVWEEFSDNSFTGVAMSPDGKTFYRSHSNSVDAIQWDGTRYAAAWSGAAEGFIDGLALSSDGESLIHSLAYNGASLYRHGAGGNYQEAWTLRELAHHNVGNWSGALAHDGDGTNLVAADDNGRLMVFSSEPFLVKDEKTAVMLKSGREVRLKDAGESVELLSGTSKALPYAPAPEASFKPRYGEKPYYFAADAENKVYMNFKGRWYPTRHKLLGKEIGGVSAETARIAGRDVEVRAVELSRLRNPYSEDPVPLTEKDFLTETPVTEEVEESALKAFADGWAVDLVGDPGSGKTAIAKELPLLLGLPRHIFLSHGGRELSDLIGGLREDEYGRLQLTAEPTHDAEGRMRFKIPLLDMLANGGVYAVDEGAVGEKGRELLSWFSAVVRGDREIVLQEFPGREIVIKVHPDFHLIITRNIPDSTPGRYKAKSEISSNVHSIQVPDDDDPLTLQRLFARFLSDEGAPIDAADAARLGGLASDVYHAVKPELGKTLGGSNKDAFYLSKREIRRAARRTAAFLRERPAGPAYQRGVPHPNSVGARPGGDARFALYRALRMTFESMFPSSEDRETVHKTIRELAERLITEADLVRVTEKSVSERQWLFFSRQAVKRIEQRLTAAQALDSWDARLMNDALAGFPAPTSRESWLEYQGEAMLKEGEPVLLLGERGARTQGIVVAMASALGADVETLDAAPEHTDLDLTGGLFPIFGLRAQDSPRSRRVLGRMTRHLKTLSEMRKGVGQGKPIVLWIRNISQWPEELRTALNGLLEDGYIDLPSGDGSVQRLYKPENVYFAAEDSDKPGQDVSSAAFNRWAKLGVSQDTRSEFESVLRSEYGLEKLEAFYLSKLYEAAHDPSIWTRQAGVEDHFGVARFYTVARAIRRARFEDPRWKSLAQGLKSAGFDPRKKPFTVPSDPGRRRLYDGYRELIAGFVVQEADRILGASLSDEPVSGVISERRGFMRLSRAVAGFSELAEEEPALLTKDGTLKSPLKAIGTIPVRGTKKAPALIEALKKSGVRPTQEARRLLALLARADSLSKVTALTGKPGGIKTATAHLWSLLTGRRFYKYQCQSASEYSDLTIGMAEDPARPGVLEKNQREFYEVLRAGHAVILLDEANAAPWVLWILETLLRGEKTVHPTSPGEPPFEIGEDVQVILTYNPHIRAGRYEIDERLLDAMIVADAGLPSEEEMPGIIETFYGVWEGLRLGGRSEEESDESGGEGIDGQEGEASAGKAGKSAGKGGSGKGKQGSEAGKESGQEQSGAKDQRAGESGSDGQTAQGDAAKPSAADGESGKGDSSDAASQAGNDASSDEPSATEKARSSEQAPDTDMPELAGDREPPEPAHDTDSPEHAGDPDPTGTTRGQEKSAQPAKDAHEEGSRGSSGSPDEGGVPVDGAADENARLELGPGEEKLLSPDVPGDHPSERGQGASSGALEQGAGGADPNEEKEDRRVGEDLERFRQGMEMEGTVAGNVAEAFARGAIESRSVFPRMMNALREKTWNSKKRSKEGFRVDPMALMLNREKKFIKRGQADRMRRTAADFLFDFSVSMADVVEDLAFAVKAAGDNLWRLREAAPRYFDYDLSWFAGADEPETVISLGERIDEAALKDRLAVMANLAAKGSGTNIPGALKGKLRDFKASPGALRAKSKYVMLFTDGDKEGNGSAVRKEGSGYVLTPAMTDILAEYEKADVHVIVVGLGEGAVQVSAFKGPKQHFIRIAGGRTDDIVEALSKVAERMGMGKGALPAGDVTAELGIGSR
ncbi:MAG: AAA family ATPase [Elusimicrobiota bacterium]